MYVNNIENRLHLKLKQGIFFLTFNTPNNEITWKHQKKREINMKMVKLFLI